MLQEAFEDLLKETVKAIQSHYGDRLVTVAVYGSVGRGTMRFDSDIDLLIIARGLPNGRWTRAREFDAVEEVLEPAFMDARRHGIDTKLSVVLKTPEEAEAGSPLFLDMTEDAQLLYDRDDFFARRLERLRGRLRQLGSKRIWRGNMWYWDLKPDYKPGEVFEL
ncbi:nucleotidyltransferase domain-containing protein [Candidatus Nitrospira bockiana]